MRRQFLGDSKDAFKWDYHDYLTTSLGYSILNIMLMLRPDDNSNHGRIPPENFPAREAILDFCRDLRTQRNIQDIRNLPRATNSNYLVELHKGETCLTSRNRNDYFLGISTEPRQVLFIDPDNGFEPERSNNEKHVLYSDVRTILTQINPEDVISVFQHFRFIPFYQDFDHIREQMRRYCNTTALNSTALYWHSLMFVTISRTQEIIEQVRELNHQYSQTHPVKVLR